MQERNVHYITSCNVHYITRASIIVTVCCLVPEVLDQKASIGSARCPRLVLQLSGVATGGMGGPDPPTSVQTSPEICANPLRSILYIGGGPMHVYCNFLLLTSKEKLFGPPTFFGLATPLLQLPYRSSATDLMHRQLHWLDIRNRVRFKIGLLVFKCLHGLAPQYLSDYCVPVPVSSTRSSLRSARFQERLLIVPRTRTKTIGPRGFFHASPAVWNSLPDDLRDPELSIGCFRNKLKTFLFSQI